MRKFRGLLLGSVVAAWAIAIPACKDSNPEAKVESKARSCGLLSAGRTAPAELDGPEACYLNCIAGLSCADLTTLMCDPYGTPSAGQTACENQCLNFTCASGTTYYGSNTIAVEQKCDGRADCRDGSDETGCATFSCGDGSTVVAALHCDGQKDCASGKDEEGCPTFDCGNGSTVPADAKCDGFSDCSNGRDESAAVCQLFTCDNGQTIPAKFECDQNPDCYDGSDEHAGCAMTTCP